MDPILGAVLLAAALVTVNTIIPTALMGLCLLFAYSVTKRFRSGAETDHRP